MLGSMVANPSVACAEPLESTQAAESALGSLGLLSPVGAEVSDDARALAAESAQPSSASLSLSTGLTVEHENRTFSITPGADTTSAQTGVSGIGGSLHPVIQGC